MKRGLRQAVGAVLDAAQEGLELLGLGRLSMEPKTPFQRVHDGKGFSLRRYAAQPGRPLIERPILLVPSLAFSADSFDLDSELSVVGYLTHQGVDTWVLDFARPETAERGFERTYEDYVHAADEALEVVRSVAGRDVHLLGHSQGGVLVYQLAALRRGESISSLITLGAPVDFHSSLRLGPELSARLLPLLRGAALGALRHMDALPAQVSQGIVSLARLDARLFPRSKNEHQGREWPSRGFRPQSFTSVPAPALSSLADELLVGNRLARGGFVLGGRVASLSDLSTPLLYFVGERDDLAPRTAVAAIHQAASHVREIHEVRVPTGHLGLVLSRRAFELTWPTVVAWLRYREGRGPVPVQLAATQPTSLDGGTPEFDLSGGLTLMRDASLGVAQSARRAISLAARQTLGAVESFRYQVARLAVLERIHDGSRVSFGAMLDERAQKTPDASWFIFEGRAQTFAEANRRVDHVVRALVASGVRRGHHVGVLMNARPSYLSIVTALSRLGAVAVLLSPGSQRASLAEAQARLNLDALVADPENVEAARGEFPGKLLLLGAPRSARPELPGLIDMELIDTAAVELPPGFMRNPGRASELAMILFTAGADGTPRLGHVTHRRFVEIAYTTAALAELGSRDTVYACTPIHHAMGIALCVGGALAGGARVALASAFVPERFWAEVRRYGVTVAFYSGDMLRELLYVQSARGERDSPVRLLAGTGMRADSSRRLRDRFGIARVLEFYAVVDGTSLLVNANADKPGAAGRPLGSGARAPFLAAYSFERGEVLRDGQGRCVEAADDEPGVLLYALDPQTVERIRGSGDARRIESDVREQGDLYGFSGDVMRRDPQGELWLLDRIENVIRTRAGIVLAMPVEDVFLSLPDVRAAVLLGDPRSPVADRHGPQELLCVLSLRRGRSLDPSLLSGLCRQRLSADERPARICMVDDVPLSDGGRPRRDLLRAAIASGRGVRSQLVYDPSVDGYREEPRAIAPRA